MASQLSDEEFHRLQTQLIELRTANYGLEEQCRKLKSENQILGEKLGGLESKYQNLQKTVNKSKKIKDFDILLNENKKLQEKLESQEVEFQLQNQTLLQEFSTFVAANEKLEQELNALKIQGISHSSCTEYVREGQGEGAEISKIISEERVKAEQELGELREAIQSFSALDAADDQDDSVPSSEGDFVQVGEIDVTYQKRSTTQTDILKQAEQKLQNLEAHQKNLTDTLSRLETEREEKNRIEAELRQAQEKLRRKQDSLVQLQDEKEKLYTESRKAYEELQTNKEQEINVLKDQNQRLQVQLNNAQSILQDFKEKSAQKLQELESQISALTQKNDSSSHERMLELQAKVIELECVLSETKEELRTTKQHKSQLEERLTSAEEKLVEHQTKANEWEEEKTELKTKLEEEKLLAKKRKSLVDEMSIRIQQKSDDYKHQLSNLQNKFTDREEELKSQIEILQGEVEKLAPLQSQLDDALVQIKSLEAMRGWLERRQKEAEDSNESTKTYYESVLEHLKAEHTEEITKITLHWENCVKKLEEELEALRNESVKKCEDLCRLEQQLHDTGEEKQLAEKKWIAVMKDLRRQLAAERKRAEKLQERLRDVLNEGGHPKTDLNKSHDPETSSISSWSLMSGNCEPKDSSTRENSISNLNGNVSPPPEDQNLEQENYKLLSRITALQQEKWALEETIHHLEQGSSAMAEDLMSKTALIQYYCMGGRSEPVTSSSSSPPSEKLSVKKIVEMLKGDEHIHKSKKQMQQMLEELLTKNMHLDRHVEQLSREVERLSKGTGSSAST